ncbi:hypothetical protein BDV98DRAFT_572665 [Pterulicium gracile]|uniref:BTB domain-containing protein n=1 Tax=Pterulicium gracile TaxID=1884261 RepID=A0A5C3QBK3_9AGAR|nr:hypothetical protein BDV98DRAFT_572665 [Pterula gracilis]
MTGAGFLRQLHVALHTGHSLHLMPGVESAMFMLPSTMCPSPDECVRDRRCIPDHSSSTTTSSRECTPSSAADKEDESLDGTTTEEEESTSIEHVDDELEDSEPTESFDVCTFLDRHGVTRSTKLSLSPASDEIVVLMTSGRWRPNGFPSVFFVPRTFLSRASPSFKSLLDKMDADLADSKKRSYQRIEGVDDRLRFSSGSQEHMFIGVEDHPNDLQDFLEALHKYEKWVHSAKWTDIHSLAALLRLSMRYEVKPLFNQILSALIKDRYPLVLSQYHGASDTCTGTDHRAANLVALNVIHEVDYPPLLPILTYLTSISWSPTELAEAPIRSHAPIGGPEECWFVNERIRNLVVELRRSFSLWFLGLLHSSLLKRPAKCATKEKCRKGYAAWRERTISSGRFTTDPEAVDLFRLGSRFGVKQTWFCAVCREKATERVKGVQEEAWEMLPAFVGVGPWEELL